MELSLNIYTKLTVLTLGIFALISTFNINIVNGHTDRYCYVVIDMIEQRGTLDSSLQIKIDKLANENDLVVNISTIDIGDKKKYQVTVSYSYRYIGNLNKVWVKSVKITKAL